MEPSNEIEVIKDWHASFAYLPTVLSQGGIVWLRPIEQRQICELLPTCWSGTFTQYRSCEATYRAAGFAERLMSVLSAIRNDAIAAISPRT